MRRYDPIRKIIGFLILLLTFPVELFPLYLPIEIIIDPGTFLFPLCIKNSLTLEIPGAIKEFPGAYNLISFFHVLPMTRQPSVRIVPYHRIYTPFVVSQLPGKPDLIKIGGSLSRQ